MLHFGFQDGRLSHNPHRLLPFFAQLDRCGILTVGACPAARRAGADTLCAQQPRHPRDTAGARALPRRDVLGRADGGQPARPGHHAVEPAAALRRRTARPRRRRRLGAVAAGGDRRERGCGRLDARAGGQRRRARGGAAARGVPQQQLDRARDGHVCRPRGGARHLPRRGQHRQRRGALPVVAVAADRVLRPPRRHPSERLDRRRGAAHAGPLCVGRARRRLQHGALHGAARRDAAARGGRAQLGRPRGGAAAAHGLRRLGGRRRADDERGRLHAARRGDRRDAGQGRRIHARRLWRVRDGGAQRVAAGARRRGRRRRDAQ